MGVQERSYEIEFCCQGRQLSPSQVSKCDDLILWQVAWHYRRAAPGLQFQPCGRSSQAIGKSFNSRWVIDFREYAIQGSSVTFPDGSRHDVLYHSSTQGSIRYGGYQIDAELIADGQRIVLCNGEVLQKAPKLHYW